MTPPLWAQLAQEFHRLIDRAPVRAVRDTWPEDGEIVRTPDQIRGLATYTLVRFDRGTWSQQPITATEAETWVRS